MSEKQRRMDELFLDIAERISKESHAKKLKVGSVLVRGDNIISMGWNGMPAGMDNNCEYVLADGTMKTRPEVSHGESNCLMKLAATGIGSSDGATLYNTHPPCPSCAKLIKQGKVARFVYRYPYKEDGLAMLRAFGVAYEHIPKAEPAPLKTACVCNKKLPACTNPLCFAAQE